MNDLLFFVIGLLWLLALNLAVVAARTALLNTSMARLLSLAELSDAPLQRALILLRSPVRLQASLNLFQLILRFLLAGMLLYYLSRQEAFASAVWVALALIVFALLIFWLEWAVRSLVLRRTEMWVFRMAPFTRAIILLVTPLVALPLALAGEGETAAADEEDAGSAVVDELKSLVDASQQEGVLEQGERKMIYSIFDLGDTLAREIMIPRMDMLSLDVNTSVPEAVDALLESGHTRAPVYEESIDRILGLLYAKDLLRVWRQGSQLETIRELVRPAYFVPEAKKVDKLMEEMQRQRIHMAVVVDEYGGVAGLVTLEDVVEEILGEIQDEYDQGEELPYHELPDGEFIFQGRVDLDDFNEVMGSHLMKDEADTLGGFIYSQVGRVPASGEQVQMGGVVLTVEQVTGRRILTVRARREAPPSEDQAEVAHVDR